MADCAGSGMYPTPNTKQGNAHGACAFCGKIRQLKGNGTVKEH